MNKTKLYLSVVIFILGLLLRIWDFGKNPPGLYLDEASQGYNAYSLLKTGKDEYGKAWPVFFRSFGTYPSSLYGYFTTVPVYIFGLEPSVVRLTSLVFGLILIVLITSWLGLMPGLVVAVSPVFIFMSRAAFEANIALTIVILALILAVKAGIRHRYLPISFAMFALSAYAYHAERLLGPLMILLTSLYYWLKQPELRKNIISSLIFSLIVMLPIGLVTFYSGTNSRLQELSHTGTQLEQLGQIISHYFSYFSPKNLFIKPDPDLQRSFPELSVFHWWMIFPLFIGIFHFLKKPNKALLFLGLLSVIPGAVTKDDFSTLRVLPLFILVTLVISRGLEKISVHKKLLLLVIIFFSLIDNYSGLTLLKHERSRVWNYEYRQLSDFLLTQNKYSVIIDNSRVKPVYILLAFYSKYPPQLIQQDYPPDFLKTYYQKNAFPTEHILGNYEIRPISWADDVYKTQLIVGDKWAISDQQVSEHALHLVRSISDINGNPVLKIYLTDPEKKCLNSVKNHELYNPLCEKFTLASTVLSF